MLGLSVKSVLAMIIAVVCCTAAVATEISYFGYEEFGGTWCDAEKSPTNSEDDLMCWAAAAGNALVWTGWSTPVSTDTDEVFAYFQDHWTDAGGIMEFGWDWWFDGTNPSQGWDDWSQVDVPGGGFWDPPYDFSDYYRRTWLAEDAMDAVYTDLHDGYGVTLGIYTASGGGHAITAWGVKYDDQTGDILGVYVTDSDDDKNDSTPEDELRYYDVEFDHHSGDDGRWFLQDFYGTSDVWYIGEVMSLDQSPVVVPEPATVALMFAALSATLVAVKRRSR